ncbi:Oidioi.mRNA.OKI2018_I69.XSR.g14694.t1.cds [Oikopleura dioica]|uniref:Oidioi.mRNA.OKI2018_I69.XSR.g14694.t1.cds n=1 Tax=Oikopleura dioica TaxID=34765 RepID=A0ABN7SGV5_OIKDI|nr:Oidioi.mRNA.OKI2018_I69.XSR.g14694.t1.cds [Oikopleura dioica]
MAPEEKNAQIRNSNSSRWNIPAKWCPNSIVNCSAQHKLGDNVSCLHLFQEQIRKIRAKSRDRQIRKRENAKSTISGPVSCEADGVVHQIGPSGSDKLYLRRGNNPFVT